MSVDREVRSEPDRRTMDRVATPSRTARVSRATVSGYVVVAILLVGWFLFGWLVTRQGFINSVGESAGTAFALLLIISIVGTVRASRRGPGPVSGERPTTTRPAPPP
jgi:hypothetical protein